MILNHLFQQLMIIIPINPRDDSTLPKSGFNHDSVSICPYKPKLPMVYAGMISGDKRADRVKFICPKISSSF